MKTLKYLVVLGVALACLGLTPKANALLIGDTHELGFVEYGIPSGDQDRTNYVNHLIGMPLGTTDTGDGQTYTRSNNDFGPLGTAVWALNGTGTSIDVTGYTYLLAKYDGPNYGSEVWYVGDLSGVITIPSQGGGYGLSGWTLFTGGANSVPDGGTTVALLGMALCAVALMQRFSRRQSAGLVRQGSDL